MTTAAQNHTPTTPLPDLSTLVSQQFAALVDSGRISEMIETHLSKAVEDVLKDELRAYSKFGEAVKEKVKEALQVSALKDLPSYGEFIGNIIARNVDSQLHGAYAAKLAEDVKAMFVEPPAEITLEEFIADYKDYVRRNTYGALDPEMSLHIKRSGSSVSVSIDRASRKEWHRCEIRFQVWFEDGRIFGLHIDGHELNKELFIGPFDEFERKLFHMYVQGTRFIVPRDADSCDFDLSLHDD